MAEGERDEPIYRDLASHLPDYVALIDRERRYLWCNRYAPGLAPEMVLGRRADELISRNEVPAAVAAIESVFATGEPAFYESGAEVAGIETRWWRTRVVRAASEAGEPRVLLICQDITDQKTAELAFRLSEEKLARALSAGDVGLWELDVERGVATISPWFDLRAGIGPEITTAAWREMIHEDDREAAIAGITACFEGRASSYDQEYRVRHARTGAVRRFIARGRTTRGPGGRLLMIGSMIDVTDLRASEDRRYELQRQLEHAQRLESIGLLAGGVAHDFNNLLTVISAGVDVARLALRRGRSPEEELDHIAAATQRAAELTRRLLAFGRRSTLRGSPIDVVAMVRSVGDMARRVLPETIAIDVSAPEDAIVALGDQGQLEQVVLNLCLNARDAMPDGGRLGLDVRAEFDHAIVVVRDTGCGIPEAQRARIFEPFFTTKALGSGSGLGLAMAHGLVRQHGGEISFDTEVGRGTSFTIRLPRSSADAPVPTPTERPVPTRAHGTVLLAEDEPRVRDITARVLSGVGYQVLEAQDGLEAVQLFEAHASCVDLVILDVMMPLLDGWSAYQRIRALRSCVPVILCSGYSASVIPPDLGPDGPVLLEKPFRAGVLLRAASDAIDRARASASAA